LKYFLCKQCDVVVLEVGMGGELGLHERQLTIPEAAVITATGSTIRPTSARRSPIIARAKAGIIKEGGDVVVYGGEKDVEDGLRADLPRQKTPSCTAPTFRGSPSAAGAGRRHV
jgi:dihydrofolate synthase/folylpolyglutamate synthase